MEAMGQMEFRSPLRKLVVFFQKSRDKWKAKCVSAKYELKLLKRRFVNLESNCDQWRRPECVNDIETPFFGFSCLNGS